MKIEKHSIAFTGKIMKSYIKQVYLWNEFLFRRNLVLQEYKVIVIALTIAK
ncbi:MAG: hypothetical protein ACFCAD_11125 [Pleurocapsa sp.]